MQYDIRQAYVAGFMKAAEVAGVDPRRLVKSSRDWGISNNATERAGSATSTTALAVLGALLGRRGGKSLAGGLIGGATGVAGNVVGKTTGLLSPLRSSADQKAHDSRLHALANLLLPGYGKYNAQKRLERMQAHAWA